MSDEIKNIATLEIVKNLLEENEMLKSERDRYVRIYKHYYLQNQNMEDRFCKKCGLYLTDDIHIRVNND